MSSVEDLNAQGDISCHDLCVRGTITCGGLVLPNPLPGPITILGDLTVTGDLTVLGNLKVCQLAMCELNIPAINMSPQDNLVIAGLTSNMLLRFQLVGGPGTISVTGIDKPMPALGGFSRQWIFFNRKTSTKSLTLENENAGSMVSNRFSNHGGVARVLLPGEARTYYYDEGDSRWIEVS